MPFRNDMMPIVAAFDSNIAKISTKYSSYMQNSLQTDEIFHRKNLLSFSSFETKRFGDFIKCFAASLLYHPVSAKNLLIIETLLFAQKETLNLMKAEGWKFPAVREAEAMFEADTAPEWAEGDVCNRCRVAFGMMTRQVVPQYRS